MNERMLKPKYNTLNFSDVWKSDEEFIEDVQKECPFPLTQMFDLKVLNIIFWLVFSKYCDAPIVNSHKDIFKMKFYSIIYQYGAEWKEKDDIQAAVRKLSEEDILKGSDTIFNHAFNPSTDPTTQTTDELKYINEQQVTKYRKSKIDGYLLKWQFLNSNYTNNFLLKFDKLFKIFVSPSNEIVYVTDAEDDYDDN